MNKLDRMAHEQAARNAHADRVYDQRQAALRKQQDVEIETDIAMKVPKLLSRLEQLEAPDAVIVRVSWQEMVSRTFGRLKLENREELKAAWFLFNKDDDSTGEFSTDYYLLSDGRIAAGSYMHPSENPPRCSVSSPEYDRTPKVEVRNAIDRLIAKYQ